jgi:uncharacterized membrane protein YfcA
LDWTLYWFMFPVAICVTTTASLCGIGGPALFTPILLLVFPALGPDYPLESAVAAFGAALLTQCFGFTSAFFGYFRRRLIDFRSALPFAAVGIPFGILGALIAHGTDGDTLKLCYGLLMLVLAAALFRRAAPLPPDAGASNADTAPDMRRIVDRLGIEYTYPRPRQRLGAVATATGALFTGMVSVGIGEVLMPQFIKRHRMPVPVAAGTSVLVAILVVIACSATLVLGLIERGGLAAVPWHLVCYTIPGVVIGGQIGPRLQGRLNPNVMVKFIGGLFIAVAAAMFWIVLG